MAAWLEARRLFLGQERLVGQLRGALQGREGTEVPDPLQIGRAPHGVRGASADCAAAGTGASAATAISAHNATRCRLLIFLPPYLPVSSASLSAPARMLTRP